MEDPSASPSSSANLGGKAFWAIKTTGSSNEVWVNYVVNVFMLPFYPGEAGLIQWKLKIEQY